MPAAETAVISRAALTTAPATHHTTSAPTPPTAGSHLRGQVARRLRQLRNTLAQEGAHGVSDRLRRSLAERLAPRTTLPPVLSADLLAVDLAAPFRPHIPPVDPQRPIRANWVITPPSPGSGGHTTLFRLLHYLEQHGYRNHVYFYDAYRADHAHFVSVVRDYYRFHGPVGRVQDGMSDAHLVLATGWPTAYPIFTARSAGKRFYFIQDFEPAFYPAGATRSFAECTYRMGYHGISIGSCFASRLTSEFGMTVETIPYGCDLAQYTVQPGAQRTGIVFYARGESARRGLELGLLTLELFARQHPQIDIHIYGDRLGRLPFRYVDHGRITPAAINDIYNRCFAGLTLSFTNVSLVAVEMLAAGCIPVVNDTVEVRTDLRSPFVRYAAPYPQALAAQLSALAAESTSTSLPAQAAASIRNITWDESGAKADRIFRRALEEAKTN